MKKNSVFVVGAARAGTTAMIRMLGLSEKAVCRSEPEPNLNTESRLMWNGLLSNPYAPLIRDVLPRISKAHQANDVYVEKQVSLVPFMSDLHALTDCKFVVMTRDGKDSVESILNWHSNLFPVFYHEAVKAGEETLDPAMADSFDRSLPRPVVGEEYVDRWFLLDRLSMVSYYWNRVNLEVLRQISLLPEESVMRVDVADLNVKTIEEVYRFAGLPDFNGNAVSALLERKVNSLSDRVESATTKEHEWTEENDRVFGEYAATAMRRLGYWSTNSAKQRPEGYGKYWIELKTDIAWFEEIYNYRKPLHELFKNWFNAIDAEGRLESVIDLGFGIGHGYLDFMEGRKFTGVDINSNNIEYCRENCAVDGFRFICQDMVEDPLDEKFDLVFSHSTIDNVHDPEIFLRNACRMSGKFLYLSSYRGWFPKFRQHQISWDAETRVYFNDISPTEIGRVLKEEGFENYVIFPQKSFREDIAAETIIVASRNPVPEETLMAFHEPHQTFEPYLAENDEKKSALDVLEEVNQSCHYFSTSEGGYVADSLVDFDELIQSLATVDSRKPGTVEELICGEAGINLAVRIDVDMDLMAAADMANLASIREMPLSFYLLHTAAYYGVRDGKTFRRFSRNSAIYNLLQDCGHEVGLHTDALTIYRDWGIDGASAIRTEIEWLRSEGLRISGTAAHNCAPVYGAENFEIFDNRVIGNRNHTVSDWSYLPLGVLNEEELCLKYEANAATPSDRIGTEAQAEYLSGLPCADFNRNATWMRKYLLENPHNSWGSDFSIWHLGGGFWVISGKNQTGESVFRFGVSQEQVIGFISDLDLSLSVVLVLHPAYFGKRYAWGGDPLFSAARQRNKFLKPRYSLKYRMIRKVENRVNEMAEKERKKMNES